MADQKEKITPEAEEAKEALEEVKETAIIRGDLEAASEVRKEQQAIQAQMTSLKLGAQRRNKRKVSVLAKDVADDALIKAIVDEGYEASI